MPTYTGVRIILGHRTVKGAADIVLADILADIGLADILDEILRLYVEQDQSAEAIIAEGFDEADVKRVVRLVDINEYKRRQAAIGPRISQRGFGRDRRYPVTNGWQLGD